MRKRILLMLVIITLPVVAADVLVTTGTVYANGSIDIVSLRIVDGTPSRPGPEIGQSFIFETRDERGMLLREHRSTYTFRDVNYEPLETSSLYVRIPIEEAARTLIVRMNGTVVDRIDLTEAACIEGFCEGCADFLGVDCEEVIEAPIRPREPLDTRDQAAEGYQIPWAAYAIAIVLIAIIVLAIPRKRK